MFIKHEKIKGTIKVKKKMMLKIVLHKRNVFFKNRKKRKIYSRIIKIGYSINVYKHLIKVFINTTKKK